MASHMALPDILSEYVWTLNCWCCMLHAHLVTTILQGGHHVHLQQPSVCWKLFFKLRFTLSKTGVFQGSWTSQYLSWQEALRLPYGPRLWWCLILETWGRVKLAFVSQEFTKWRRWVERSNFLQACVMHSVQASSATAPSLIKAVNDFQHTGSSLWRSEDTQGAPMTVCRPLCVSPEVNPSVQVLLSWILDNSRMLLLHMMHRSPDRATIL
jgi:hypothetical protein